MSKNTDHQSVMAKSEDGTIQITFTIPFSVIQSNREKAAKELGESTEVPGFRKGKAPIDKVISAVSQNELLEKTLSYILPKLLTDAVEEHKIKPIIYPKFELVKAQDGEDWQIRAVTCEAPEVELGDYKQSLAKLSFATENKIWTPGSPKPVNDKGNKETSREEKEQKVLKSLLETVKVKIPKILVNEEVDSRLSGLLSRIEKLGLTLESYLSSTGKTAPDLRSDYEKQAVEGLTLDFILSKIAEEEKIDVDKSEIDAALQATEGADKQNVQLDTPERRRFIEVILKRRKALDSLLSLT